jgi:hypothetical protein
MIPNLTTVNTGGGPKPACSKLDTLQQRLACLADAGLEAIEHRLAELDREWTAGRATQTVIAVLIVAGFGLTALVSPWWLALAAFAGVFLIQYLVTGSSWLAALFHSLGFRTRFEVDQERMALKVLRGDFRTLPTVQDIESREDISRLEGEGGIAVDPDDSKVEPLDAAKVALEAATRQ